MRYTSSVLSAISIAGAVSAAERGNPPPGQKMGGGSSRLGLFDDGKREEGKGKGKKKGGSKTYVVTLDDSKKGNEDSECAALAEEMGGAVQYVYDKALSGCSLIVPKDSTSALMNNPGVAMIGEDEHAIPERERWPLCQGWENICQYYSGTAPSWGLDRINQRGPALDHISQKVNANGVKVYILDTGIQGDLEEFEGIIDKSSDCHASFQVDYKEFVRKKDPLVDGDFGQHHGTFVASIACGKDYGVAKDCILCSVKTTEEISYILKGIEHVMNDCQNDPRNGCVLNFSSGVIEYSDLSKELNEAFTNAAKMGIVVVTAAGNEREDACAHVPANNDRVITVGAIGLEDKLSSHTNYGDCVNVYAPGVDVEAVASHGWFSGQIVETREGTSWAAAHVTGIAAGHLQEGMPGNFVGHQIEGYAVKLGIDERTPDAGIATVMTHNVKIPLCP